MADVCTHAEATLVEPNTDGCEECLRDGGDWEIGGVPPAPSHD
ncbi:MAG: hypothetical protein ACRDKJ_01820 [Actinomycetota bacterium]